MGVPASNLNLNASLTQIQQIASSWRGYAQQAVTTLQGGNVDSNWVFSFLDTMRANSLRIGSFGGGAPLDTHAQENVPGYAGTLSADISATQAASDACINWVVTNFPKDSTNSFILSHTLNADGTRTPRSFTPAQTAGLRTALNSFIATIT